MSAKAEDMVCPECGKGDQLQEVWWTCAQAPVEAKMVDGECVVETYYDEQKTYWDAIVDAGLCCQGCGWGLNVWPQVPDDAPSSSQLVTAAEWEKRQVPA